MAHLVCVTVASFGILLLLGSTPSSSADDQSSIDYKNYKVYHVLPVNEHQLKILYDVSIDSGMESPVDFWLPPKRVGVPVDIMISPPYQPSMESLFRAAGVNFTVKVDNVQRLIDANRDAQKLAAARRKSTTFDLGAYHTFDEINVFVNSTPKAFPKIATTFDVGVSYEGRRMTGIKIGTPAPNKKAVWIDAGIHAREWIAPATAVFIVNELTRKYGSDPVVTNLVDKLDWYILAVANPDGYEYSWKSDRMWRKTRSKQRCSGTRCCFGVDPNRNFAFGFGGLGTSSDPCSEIFRGTSAFSEPETKAISTTLLRLKNSLKAYLTLHSYGQYWLVPYGHTNPPAFPTDYSELLKAAQDGASALKALYGTSYEVGNSAEQLYPAAGASDDWSKGVAGIKFVYTIELRPSDSYGFVLPASQIIPTGQETWAGIKVIAQRVLGL